MKRDYRPRRTVAPSYPTLLDLRRLRRGILTAVGAVLVGASGLHGCSSDTQEQTPTRDARPTSGVPAPDSAFIDTGVTDTGDYLWSDGVGVADTGVRDTPDVSTTDGLPPFDAGVRDTGEKGDGRIIDTGLPPGDE